MTQQNYPEAKYLTARNAALVYGVHRDYFRKCPELRKDRIVLSPKLHLYSVANLEAHFQAHRGG